MTHPAQADEAKGMTPGQLHSWWQSSTDWRHMMMTPDVEPVPANTPHPADNGCGIYMLFGADDGLDYVGKAIDLAQRVGQHWLDGRYGRKPKFASYAWLHLPPHAVHDIEVAHIYALEPPRNLLYEPPRWEQHDAMVAAIRELWGPKQ